MFNSITKTTHEMFSSLISNIITFFTQSTWLGKFLAVVLLWFSPAMELFLLLNALVAIDYLLDLYHTARTYSQTREKPLRLLIWDQTKLFGTKVIFYSIMVIVINALQIHLVKDAFDLFRWVIAVPILGETAGILGTIELYTGVRVQGALKKMFGSFLTTKGVDPDLMDEVKESKDLKNQ